VALIEQCILFSGVKSGVLVDPFMGSGSSAVAAQRQGLAYIGFDIDADYIQFAEDRIRNQDRYNTCVEAGKQYISGSCVE
jgi:site-specific DNA-methyltransferase (adenine-specific)